MPAIVRGLFGLVARSIAIVVVVGPLGRGGNGLGGTSFALVISLPLDLLPQGGIEVYRIDSEIILKRSSQCLFKTYPLQPAGRQGCWRQVACP